MNPRKRQSDIVCACDAGIRLQRALQPRSKMLAKDDIQEEINTGRIGTHL